jgi:hypothetical protein
MWIEENTIATKRRLGKLLFLCWDSHRGVLCSINHVPAGGMANTKLVEVEVQRSTAWEARGSYNYPSIVPNA